MPYTLGLLSYIPIVRVGETFRTLDLWARDLQVQVTQTAQLKLFCPLQDTPPVEWSAMCEIPKEIELVPLRDFREARISSAIAGCDVIQVPGGLGWYNARGARHFMRVAHRYGIKCIVGMSSNPARSALLNSRSGGIWAGLKGIVKYASIRCAQRHLTANADGTFVVGEGLRPLVSPRCKHLHVSIASWIQQSDLDAAPRLADQSTDSAVARLCIASRLEPMKGVHLGIEALQTLASRRPDAGFQLTILGNGSERKALEEQVKSGHLSQLVRFGGFKSYPAEFFAELRRHGLVLLTNLSDEQPRLVFDAISQGCIPVCPDSPAYRSLELPRELLYRQGSSGSLAETIEKIKDTGNLPALLSRLRLVGKRFTLEAMHAERSAWIMADVLGKST